MANNFVRTTGGLVIPRPPTVGIKKLNVEQLELVEASRLALRSAHNSVEDILMGAAIRTADGQIFMGANLRGTGVKRHMHAEDMALISAERSGVIGGIQAVATVPNRGDPKLPCDTCSRMFLLRAAKSGIDTQIILSNGKKTRFVIINVTEMFARRNLPHGEIEFD